MGNPDEGQYLNNRHQPHKNKFMSVNVHEYLIIDGLPSQGWPCSMFVKAFASHGLIFFWLIVHIERT